jgi:hypothetical protein
MQRFRARLFLKGRFMKNRAKLSPLLLALGLALSVMSMTAGPAHAQATAASGAGEGSIELGNTSGTGDQPAAAPEASAAAADADATADAKDKPPKDPREAYRDLVLQQASDGSSATSAVSRRYKKVDKATYNELLQSGAFQPAQPAQ